MSQSTVTRRLLRSPLVDLLVGPHGIDRYLELIRPDITVRDARARVVSVRRQTARSVTLTLRPNTAWAGFEAGQFVRIGVEIDGVRRTRTYSPASSPYRASETLELTVTTHPDGVVSNHLHGWLHPGAVIHLGAAQGEFVLPRERPSRLALISGGSGITPVLSMLRTLCDEGHTGQVAFLHFARTTADWLYRDELHELAARHPNLTVKYVATREGGGYIDQPMVERLIGPLADAEGAVCGPPRLIEAVQELWDGRALSETFTPASALLAGASDAATGTLKFAASDVSVPIAAGTLLEQAEAAGLTPDYGCRMGICHTCTCRKLAGPVRNLLSGEVSDEEDEDIQLCVSVPAGNVALEI